MAYCRICNKFIPNDARILRPYDRCAKCLIEEELNTSLKWRGWDNRFDKMSKAQRLAEGFEMLEDWELLEG